jgi:hypothetical protein
MPIVVLRWSWLVCWLLACLVPLRAQELNDRDRLARLAAIAASLQDPATDGEALATEAARLCGFVLWNEQRAVVAEPLVAPRLFLAVTPSELRGAVAMLRAGHRVGRDDLFAGVDVLYASLGLPGSAVPAAQAWLLSGGSTSNASARALWVFLDDLGVQHGASITTAADCELDPLQALLIVRVLSEDIATPLRAALLRGEIGVGVPSDRGDKPKGPFVGEVARFDSDTAPFGDAPGWAEDAYVGGITGLFTEVVEGIGKVGKGLSDGIGKANAIASIGKFILTYTFLKGRVWDDDPDNPLIRTKTRDAGEQCTLYAAFWIDGSKVTDWLKDNRQVAALAGLDLDMPKSGPLKGIETEWDIKQSRDSSKYHLIQTVRGQRDISKIPTDGEGIASIEIEGCPQPKKIDPTQAMPIEKKVRIVVTPQVKATEMQQDLVDAVTGAIGIRGGGIGFLTPVIECLYRMKWKGGVTYDLQVRDWVAGETIGQAEMTLQASGSRFSRTSAFRHSIDRKLVFADVTMDVMGFDPPPPPDPKLLKMVPKAMREQMEEGYRQMAELAKKRMFSGKKPGRGEVHVHDRVSGRGVEDGCGDETIEHWSTTDGDRVFEFGGDDGAWPLMFMVDCDLEKKVATLRLMAAADCKLVSFRRRGREPAEQKETAGEVEVFGGLQLLPPFADGAITMPLKETPGVDPGVTNYYGVVAVPVKFSGFQGTMHVSWSVHRFVKKDK